MAVSDAELIQLLKGAEAGTRGPQGEPGIGIDEIVQSDPSSFVITLTNGKTHRIELAAGRDGAPGRPGRDGSRGTEGPAGSRGGAGPMGPAGADGRDGVDGVSIDSAIVSAQGNLLIGLTDGSIVDAGRVVGPPGVGERGPVGLRGSDGADGAAVLSGPRAPKGSDGKDGDHWIDLSTPEFGFYKRSSGSWTKLANMRTPPQELGGQRTTVGGAGGGAGGSNHRPPIIDDGTGTPPAVYPEGNTGGPLHEGDFWVDANGALHVYIGGQWNKIRVYSDMVLPAGDAPAGSSRDVDGSVEVSGNGGTGQAIAEAANGETFANQFEFNNWLYYRVDRAPIVADDEPAEHPDFPVTGLKDGDYWINAGNQLYVWKTHQWIPLFAKGLLDVSDQAPADPQLGQLWFNTKPEELTLYVSTLDDLGQPVWAPAAPPVSLDGIQSQIDSAVIIQDDLVSRVTSGEGKQRALENKVAALEGTVVDGVWKYGSRAWPQNRGEFDIAINDDTKTTAWQDATKLRIFNTDVKGRNFTFSEVSVADFVRIGQLGSNAVYKILSEARPKDDYFEFLVEIVSYEGEALEAIIDYNFEFLPAFDATAYATKSYVDDMDALNVKKTGSTMTGNLQFDSGNKDIQINNGGRLRIKGKDADGDGRTFIDIQTADSDGTAGADAGYRLKLYHVAAPTERLHAANRQYVDDQVSGLASEQYVDDAIDALPSAPNLNNYATKAFAEDLAYRPARLRWLFEGKDLGNSTPAHQSFKFDGKFVRCSFKTLNNVDLGVGLVGDTGAINFTDGPVGIIWYRDGELKWKMKQQFRINSWRWNYNGHFEFARSSKHPDNDDTAFTVGAAYYITVGGFF